MSIYCTYITFYRGNKLPPFYIGSTSVEKVNKGYHGSVSSKRWKQIYRTEIKENPNLFTTEILTLHDKREDALKQEYYLQTTNDVIKSKWFFNESFASINGYFGSTTKGIIRSEKEREKMSQARRLKNLKDNGFSSIEDAYTKLHQYVNNYCTLNKLSKISGLTGFMLKIIFPETNTNEYRTISIKTQTQTVSYKEKMSYALSKFIGPKIPKYYHLAFTPNRDIIGYISNKDPRWASGEIISILKCKPKSQAHKDKMKEMRPDVKGAKNPFYGKHHSNESKLKIAQREYPTRAIIVNNIEYRSCGEAEKTLNIPRGIIGRLLISGKYHKKYKISAHYAES